MQRNACNFGCGPSACLHRACAHSCPRSCARVAGGPCPYSRQLPFLHEVNGTSILKTARRARRRLRTDQRQLLAESRCGAVAVGRTYLFPPLSSGGALVVRPWLRFHIPLLEPDLQISRIRLLWGFLCQGITPFLSS